VNPSNRYTDLSASLEKVISVAIAELGLTPEATYEPSQTTSLKSRGVEVEFSPGAAAQLGLPPAATVTAEPAQAENVPSKRSTSESSRLAEERFERLVETIATSVWILRQSRIIYANPAGADLLKYERTRLIGVRFDELIAQEDVDSFAENAARAERGEPVAPREYHVFSRDGRPLIIEISSVALEYDGGAAVVSFGRDVTLRKRLELELLQADRLSALGLLAGGMAHALNNPLTYVVLNLEHVARHLPQLAFDSAGQAEVLARLVEAKQGAERMATTVKRMRSLARTDESVGKVVDLRHVLESVVELVGHEIHHRGRLTTRFEDVPLVLANESKIEQICLGLLLFAAQMLPDDTSVRHEVRLTLETDERNFAVLEIVCEGCRVEPMEIERLFAPFTATEEGRIRSAGLSVCCSLVEQLGGNIVAEALAGTGLLLRTTIPCAPVQRPAPSSVRTGPPSTQAPVNLGRARILLVDDDPGVGNALRLLFEGGHDVRCFEDPQAALRELLAEPGYDLVFCDLMMPELTGIDIYQVLRFNRPGYESKMVFMTGGAFTPATARFLQQVPNERIEKPFNVKILQRLVQKAVRKNG